MVVVTAKPKNYAHRYIFAIVAVIAAAILYSVWAIHVDRAKQSNSLAADCAMTVKLVDPCRPWLAATANKYPNVSPDNTLGQDTAFIARTGKTPDAFKLYKRAGDVLSSDDKYLATHNKFLMLNWKPVSGGWDQITTDPTTVNANVLAMANSIKSIPNAKIMLTIWHEGENDVSPGGDPNCPNVNYKGTMGTVDQYKAMWAYVHDQLLADLTANNSGYNTNNIVFAMDYMNYPTWDCLVPDMYPGDQYVDWIVFNAYGGNNGQTFSQNVRGYYNMLTQAHPTKQFGIAEFSAVNTTSAQGVAYYNQARTVVEQNSFPMLKLYMTFDSIGTGGTEDRGDYVVGGVYDQPKTDAFNAFVNSPAFVDSTPPDATPPTVSLTAPKTGTTVSGSVALTASANDNVGVTNVQFYAGSTLIANDAQGSDGWNTSWLSASVPNGTYTLKAVAYDAAGNSATSSVNVVVNNNAPPVITSFTANPTTIVAGNTSTLSWSDQNTTKCSVTPGGPTGTTQTSWTTGTLTSTTSFTLSCTGTGGTTTASTTVAVVPLPKITAFTASPASVVVGNSSTLSWSTTNAVSCSVTPGGATNTTDTSWQTLSLTNVGTQTYTLTCQNAASSTTTATVNVVVTNPLNPPSNVVLSSSSQSVVKGGRVTFSWTSTGSSSCTLNPGNYTASGTSSSVSIKNIRQTTAYQVTCKNNGGSTLSNVVKITVTSAPGTNGPIILSFYAYPATIARSTQTILYWATNNVTAGHCSISPSPVTSTYANGRWTTPKLYTTTTYTLTCRNSVGKTSKQATVTVGGTAALPLTAPTGNFSDSIRLAATTTSTSDGMLTATTGQRVVDAQSVGEVPTGSLLTLNPALITDATQITSISRVEFYDGQTLAETVTQAPFALNTNALKTNGVHQITERDYYTDGSSAESSELVNLASSATPRAASLATGTLVAVLTAALLAISFILFRLRRHYANLALSAETQSKSS
ncbi:MAG TPA: Ig-like domain-containing protein [Candidatus Saccharimonadales bacterium]|nr:Ig-like domain-containing protein [Candidatus Saccharimonadales bacterium]